MTLIFKLLLPILAGIWLVRAVFRVVRHIGQLSHPDFKNDGTRPSTPTDQVIDICPECGNVKVAFHRCPQT